MYTYTTSTTNMTPAQLRKLADELEAKQNEKPLAKPAAEIDVVKFIDFAKQCREEVANGNFDEDNELNGWELIMTEVFGKDYFKWHNKMLD